MQDYEELHKKEREFHDAWAKSMDPAQVEVEKAFTAVTLPEARWILAQLGDLRGKKILELGSGLGEAAINFAQRGASVVASDVSPGMLDLVKRVACRHDVQVETCLCSADDLSAFADESFDIVYAANLLHHVDIPRTLNEVVRVLKKGGMGAFWDPVAHNPIINVYRRMANEVRTADEHPLRRRDLSLFRQRFGKVKTRFFWLSSLLIFAKFYLLDRVHPNQDRYWKRIVSHEASLRKWYLPLAAADRVLLTLCPILGWWCWNVAIIARKGVVVR